MAVMYGYTIASSLNEPRWTPLGDPAPADPRLSETGQPVYPAAAGVYQPLVAPAPAPSPRPVRAPAAARPAPEPAPPSGPLVPPPPGSPGAATVTVPPPPAQRPGTTGS